MTLRNSYIASQLVAATALLAGCSGGTQTPMTTLPNAAAPMSGLSQPLDRQRQGCQNDGGGLTVRPCRIRFDAEHSGPQDVTVTHGGGHDGNKHVIRESDDCASRNIASIVADSKGLFTVTAGSSRGACTAQFSDENGNRDRGRGGRGGNGNGSDLRIVNAI